MSPLPNRDRMTMSILKDKSREELKKLLIKYQNIEKELHPKYFNIHTRQDVEKEYKANQRNAIKVATVLRDYDKLYEYVKPTVYTKNIVTGKNIKENEVLRKDW